MSNPNDDCFDALKKYEELYNKSGTRNQYTRVIYQIDNLTDTKCRQKFLDLLHCVRDTNSMYNCYVLDRLARLCVEKNKQ